MGESVHKGCVLCTIDGSDIQNSINVLHSQLATADAAIEAARLNLELANGSAMQSQITAAKANVDQLKLQLDNAKKRYDENKTLYDSGYISRQVYEQYENAYNQALISYNQAKESYDLLQNKTSQENIQRAQAALDQAKASKQSILAQIESSRSSLNDTIVTSPITGVVTARNVTAGALASSAQPSFVIANIDVVTIDVAVSEQIINRLSIGQSVDVEITSLSNDRISGTISTLNPVANPVSGTYDVKISINNPDNILKPGMFGKVYFVSEQNDNALILPVSAVVGNEEKYVYTEQNGIVKKVFVKTGMENGEEVEIIEGLGENQSVVIKGQTYLNDGDEVRVVGEASKED